MSEVPEPTREELLKEHKYCQETAQSMETTIWQTGATMSLGLIGSFLLVVLRSPVDQPPWYIALLAGLFMVVIAFIWWLVAKRWWSVQHAMFMRMRHIERRLGLHATWYVQYIDHPDQLPALGLNQTEVNDLQKRSSDKDRIGIRRHQHWGVQATLQYLPFVILLAWVIYVAILLSAQNTCGGIAG